MKNLWAIGVLYLMSVAAFGEKPASSNAAPASGEKGQKIDVDKLRSQYWAKGEGDEMAVIQNRQYAKSKRLEVGLMGGGVASDPFVSTLLVGGRVGYYLNETFAIEAVGWKSFSSHSSAYDVLANQAASVRTNPPSAFAGGGVAWDPIYGKLNFVGNSIWHFDLGLRAGAGVTFTETGNYLTPYLGIGQRLYLTKMLSLTFDYKLMYYSEQVPDNVASGSPQTYSTRANWSNVILLGLGFLF